MENEELDMFACLPTDAASVAENGVVDASDVQAQESTAVTVVMGDGDVDIVDDRLNPDQLAFIDFDEWWKIEWQGMPEFVQDDNLPCKTLVVNFPCRDDMVAFAELIGQRITADTPSVWFPKKDRVRRIDVAYIDEE